MFVFKRGGKLSLIFFLIILLGWGLIACSQSSSNQGKDVNQTGVQSDQSGSRETIKMRMGQSKAANHPISLGIDKFAELVEEKTKGEIVIENYHDALLGSDREVIESAQQGTLELASSSTPNMASFTNKFIAWDLPYIFETKEEVYQAMDGAPGEEIAKDFEERGFKLIAILDYGFRQFVNNAREVRVPSDMKGMKIRTTNSPVEQAVFEAFGANPTPIAWGEVFTALQQGTVEGEGNSYSLLWDTRHQEVLKYATEIYYNYSADTLVMNLDIFNSLSEEHQKAIMEAAKEAIEYQRELATKADEEAKQKFIDYGIEIYEPTEEEYRQWKKAAEVVWDKFIVPGQADPEYVDLILETIGKTRESIFR